MPRLDGFTKFEEQGKRDKPTKGEKLKKRRREKDSKRAAKRGTEKSRREKLKQTRKRLNARADFEAQQIMQEGR